MVPSCLKEALSFRAVELALQGQCERDGEVVRLASQERVHQRPPPERSSERFGEQNETVEVTEISSKNQIFQRTGDEILKDFAQDRVQQRLDEQSFVPQKMEQLEEVPKMMSHNGIQRRTAEQIVDFLALVFLERIITRICGLSGFRRAMPRSQARTRGGQSYISGADS